MDSALNPKKVSKRLYPERDPDSHKYDFGHLLVVGGSKKYSGSPTFNSLGAYRSGVDLVTTAVPESIANTISSFSPSLITHPLSKSYISPFDTSELEGLAEKADAVVIGGGVERREETMKCVRNFLKGLNIPSVIDADAIHAVAGKKELLKEDFILTPHLREFEVLADSEIPKGLNERKKLIKQVASELGATILLKGRTDLMSQGEKVLENETGTPYLTKGGTGDILAGIAGGLLARGSEAIDSAYGAAYLTGKAGEIASKDKKEGLMPEEILEKIPQAIEKFRSKS